MPTYESNLTWLKEAIDSVRAQTYPYWELCIADDASKNPELIAALKQAAREEPRIRLHFRDQNGHIAACSNSALQRATGDFIVLLDHDDVLPPQALSRLAEAIAANPDVEMIYTDEDKISETGAPIDEPYRKGKWDLDLFLGHNFFNHLGCYRLSSVREIGGFRTDFAGSQDYDLVLRMILHKGEKHILHIPEILYHWRAVTGSVADEMDAKPYATEAARRAIHDFLSARYPGAIVKPHLEPAFHEVIWPQPKAPYPATIIVLNGENLQLRENIKRTTEYPDLDIVLSEKPLEAAKNAKGNVIIFLDAATEIDNRPEFNNTGRSWLNELVAVAARSDVAFVSPKIAHPDGRLITSGIRAHEDFGYFGRARTTHMEDVVPFEATAIRREVLAKLMPAQNHLELCKKAVQAGYKNLVHGSIVVKLHKKRPLLRRVIDRLPHRAKSILKRYLRTPIQFLRRFLSI